VKKTNKILLFFALNYNIYKFKVGRYFWKFALDISLRRYKFKNLENKEMASINTSNIVRSLTGKYAAWIVIFIGVLTSALIFWLEYRDNKLQLEKVFFEDASQAAAQLKKNFAVNEMVFIAFANFFACSDNVTENEFRNFASPFFEKLKCIYGIGFLEKSGTSNGSTEVCFPIKYFQVRKKDNAAYSGHDLSSGGRVDSNIRKSLISGGTVIDSYPLFPGDTSSVLFWYVPVFKFPSVKMNGAESLECLIGFIVGMNKLEDMARLFLNTELEAGVNLIVYLDEDSDKNIVYGSKMSDAKLTVKNFINICGRKLFLTWQAGSGYKGGIETNSAWLIAQFIVIITLFLVNMIKIMGAYTLRIEEEVKSRTQELFKANQMLEKEIGFRGNVEADLIKTSLTATNILESMSEAFVSFDYEWNFTYVNPAAEKTLGISRAEIIGKSAWTVFSESLTLKFYEQFRMVMKERVPSNFEEYYTNRELWLSVNAYPTLDGVSVYFADVTGLKKTSRGDI